LRLQGTLRPRFAKPGETLVLLDGKQLKLEADTMVVTDDSGAIGLAGIMGGLDTAVTEATTDVYFEAAFWPPEVMAGRARAYGLHTDASLRFERGVDPSGQARAVERASALLLQIAGGRPGPLDVTVDDAHLPARRTVDLRQERIARLLGVDIDAATVSDILGRLGLDAMESSDGWRVQPPPYRFDIGIEEDLIEEVARIYGYDNIPERTGMAALPLVPVTELRVAEDSAAALLVARDYREVITYSFIANADDAATSGELSALRLSNPISSEMSVMRSSLWSGMLRACAANLARQQERVRLFEIGRSYHGSPDAPREIQRIAGLACGPALPEQWSATAKPVDFFDIKSDLDAVLALGGAPDRVDYEPAAHPALQPGQAAQLSIGGTRIGALGKLHPRIARDFDIKRPVYLFELDAKAALAAQLPVAESISRFPAIRRDIAVLVAERVTAAELVRAVRETAPAQVRAVRIFDVYRGPGVEAGLKSVAIGLILQETSRTLTDDDADAAQAAAVQKLHQEFAAVLRD
jgi:phenylalanyl-tRNA synthetase beta chain